MKFPLPSAALEHHTAILGKTGSGKTSTAKLLVEQVVASGARVCILDTIKSDWWGITSSADGKKPGLPFQILGGPKGHVPLPSSAGKAVAEIVANGALPLSIIDMADFEPGGIQKFFVDFAPTLLKKMRGVVYLVVEEAHELAPKERAGFGAENLAIHWAKKLATAGRSRGVRLVVATQRTQSLHNAVLGSCETVIVHRLTTPADQKPVLDWLKANGSKDALKGVAESLSSLKTGTAWLCSGEAEIFQQISFPRIRTYDNTATPMADADDHHVKMAPVDVDKLRDIIGTAVAEAEATDPKKLQAKIKELQQAIARGGVAEPAASAPSAHAIREAEDRGRRLGWEEGRETHFADGYRAALKHAAAALAAIETPKAPTALPPPKPKAAAVTAAPRQAPAKAAPAGDLSGPEAKMLGALAWWEAIGKSQPSRAMVGAICGWRVTSGHLKNVSGSLSSKGLVHYPSGGRIALTDAGRAVAPPAPHGALHDMVRDILDGPQRTAFNALLELGAVSRERLCEAIGWNPTSGHPKNVLGSLSSLEIVEYPKPGHVALVDWLRAA